METTNLSRRYMLAALATAGAGASLPLTAGPVAAQTRGIQVRNPSRSAIPAASSLRSNSVHQAVSTPELSYA